MYYDHSAVGIGFHEATSLALFGPGEMSPRQTTQRPEHCSQGFPLRQQEITGIAFLDRDDFTHLA